MDNRPDNTRKPTDLGEGGEVPFPVVHNGMRTDVSEAIDLSAVEIYNYWRDFSHHPQFMQHLENVEILDHRKSHWLWQVKPFGLEIEWTSEIIADVPGKMLSWQTLPNSDIRQAGSVWFKPLTHHRTLVHWLLAWEQPGGKLTSTVAKLLGEDPAHTMREDLKRLKKLLEGSRIHH